MKSDFKPLVYSAGNPSLLKCKLALPLGFEVKNRAPSAVLGEVCLIFKEEKRLEAN